MKNISQHFKKISLIAIVLILIGVTGLFVVGYDDQMHTITVDAVIGSEGIDQVFIRTSNQNIRIHHTADSEARVVSSGMPSNATLISEVVDGVLMIETRTPRQIQIGVNFGSIRNLLMDPPSLDVYLPTIIYESVAIHSTNGRVEVFGFEIHDLQIETTNSRVEVHDIDGNVNVRSANGRLELSHLTGDIDAQTTNGRIAFNNDTIEQNVRLQSTNGSIEVTLSEEPSDTLFDLRTTNGRTAIFGNNNSTQQFGNGSFEVTLRTTNGSITVE